MYRELPVAWPGTVAWEVKRVGSDGADRAHLARELRPPAGKPLSELVGQDGRAAYTSTWLPSGSDTVA